MSNLPLNRFTDLPFEHFIPRTVDEYMYYYDRCCLRNELLNDPDWLSWLEKIGNEREFYTCKLAPLWNSEGTISLGEQGPGLVRIWRHE